jgi:hypothetical protein
MRHTPIAIKSVTGMAWSEIVASPTNTRWNAAIAAPMINAPLSACGSHSIITRPRPVNPRTNKMTAKLIDSAVII